MPRPLVALRWGIVFAWLIALTVFANWRRGDVVEPAATLDAGHLVGAPTPFPTPGDAGLSLVSNGQGPMPTWQVPPRNVVTWTDVYINASTGSNSNLGTTMMSPWGTNAALDKYIGLYGKMSPTPMTPTPPAGGQYVTIHYEGAMPTDLLNVQAFLDANIALRLMATDLVTVVHTGTISAAVGYSNSNTLATITDGSISSWGPYVGHRFTWTGGSASGAIGWIVADLGGGVARIGQTGRTNDPVATGVSFPTPVAPSTGTYAIDDVLPTLYIGLFDVQATNNGNQIEAFVNAVDLNLAATGPIGADPNPTGAPITYLLNGCSCTWQSLNGIQMIASLSYFPDGLQLRTGSNVTLVASVVASSLRFIFGSFGLISDNTLIEGAGLLVADGSYVEVDSVVVENAAATLGNQYGDAIVNVASYFAPGTIALRGPAVGSGNAGVGVRSARGTSITATQTPKVTGTLGDFALDQDTSDFAWNNATGAYVATPVTDTWAHLSTNLTGSGFGGSAHAPRSNTHFISPDVN